MPVVLGLLVATLMAPQPLAAQENGAWPERAFITIDVSFQASNNDFSESLSFADAPRKTENVTFVARYASTRGALLDLGGGIRLANNLGGGVTVSWFQRSGAGTFDLMVPNPITADKPLGVAGSISALNRNELGVHIEALYGLRLGRRAHVMLAAGPSVFNTKQDLVRSIEFDRLPGFTGLEFDEALITEVTRTVVGFNLGARITWMLASHLGVGTVTRYSRATLTLDPGSESGVSRAIKRQAGGVHFGGGIRLLF